MVKTFLSKFKIFNFKSAKLCFEESFSNRMFEGFKTLFWNFTKKDDFHWKSFPCKFMFLLSFF